MFDEMPSKTAILNKFIPNYEIIICKVLFLVIQLLIFFKRKKIKIKFTVHFKNELNVFY